MKIIEFEWDQANINHMVFKHQVTTIEVEECCHSYDHLTIRAQKRRYYTFGQSEAGRYLFVVLEFKGKGIARVVTARDMTAKEKRFYQSRRR